jgi:hypothetical protein
MWKISKSTVNRPSIFTMPCCTAPIDPCKAEKVLHSQFVSQVFQKGKSVLKGSSLIGPECCNETCSG